MLSGSSHDVRKHTAIATTTFYNLGTESDKIRAVLAQDTLVRAQDAGYKIACVDGGSSDEFLKYLHSHGIPVVPEAEKGIGKSRRQAMRLAYDTQKPVLVWTEPEKNSLISDLEKAVEPVYFGESDLVVPRRKSLQSYPTSQQQAEAYGNTVFKELTGHDIDLWFGPRVFSRNAASYFLQYDGKYGDAWDSIFIPVMDMLAAGKKVRGDIAVDYIHPPEQTRIEEGNFTFSIKRLNQLDNLIPALQQHWASLPGGKK